MAYTEKSLLEFWAAVICPLCTGFRVKSLGLRTQTSTDLCETQSCFQSSDDVEKKEAVSSSRNNVLYRPSLYPGT